MNNLSLAPLSSPDLWSQAVTVAESPETKVDRLEREADEQVQHLPEAQRAAYRTMVRREIAQIRTLITHMRAQGFQENAINNAIGGLTQKFYESKNRFLEGNEQFAINKARVCATNQATANKIRQCTPDFSPIARIPIDDEDDMADQPYSEPLLPRADESVQASFQGFLRDKAMERVAMARVTAATLNAIGYVVKESAAVVLGCRGSEEGKKNCQAVLGYVKTGAEKVEEVAKDVVTWMGAKPALKRMMSGNAITQCLVELGIDHASAQQYVEDCNTISLQLVFEGSMTGATKIFRTAFPPMPKQAPKLIEGPSHNKPFPHRVDYSQDYLQAKKEFIAPKEFDGILSKDLLVVRYHNSTGTRKWFMPISEGNKHWTVNEIKDAMAKLDKFGDVTEVSLARIPAGEPVRFLHGRAKEQIDVLSNETRPGGGVQYRFFNFDLRWIKETREMPGVKTPPLSLQERFDAYKKNDWHQNRTISKRTKIVPEDLGIPSSEFFKGRKPFQSNRYGLDGWMTLKKDILKVKIEWLKVPEGRFSNWMGVISNLRKIAKANGATTIQYEAQIVNRKLLNVMTKKFGEPKIEIKSHFNEPTSYHIFKIPVGE